jgi:hypothetical protein
MTTPEENHGHELEASLRRLRDAMATGQKDRAELITAIVSATQAHVAQRISEKLERHGQRAAWRAERRAARHARRMQRLMSRHGDDEHPSFARGLAFGGAAALLVHFAMQRPESLWWLSFVAFGFGMAALSSFGRSLRRLLSTPEPKPDSQVEVKAEVKAEVESDPQAARVEALCKKLLADIETGPAILREIVHEPKETVDGLAAAYHELSGRARELREALAVDSDEHLQAERDKLAARVAAEPDEVVQARLRAAQQALEQQIENRAELTTAASRLDAEAMRILYTLESLTTQVLRARAADSGSADVAGAKLRKSLDDLTQEVSAVAEALEVTHNTTSHAARAAAAAQKAQAAR